MSRARLATGDTLLVAGSLNLLARMRTLRIACGVVLLVANLFFIFF
jgi:hypothetical protein